MRWPASLTRQARVLPSHYSTLDSTGQKTRDPSQARRDRRSAFHTSGKSRADVDTLVSPPFETVEKVGLQDGS